MVLMRYRPEIDGLRAIAVVPVILFHAEFGFFSGGYVGVDVFFVISGYLITSLLIEDIERDRFSLVHFYERRVRRIFPALFLVVALCIPPAWMLMLPDQFKDFSQSVGAVILFSSNFLFWQETGYFAGPSELKPLLHTWSLSVEEQFYVFFPLLLVFLWRFGVRRTVIVLVVLSLASLLATEWGWRNARMANFFLLPFRMWELLAGSLCAIYLKRNAVPGNDLLGLAGLAMILASVVAFDKTTPFPSFWALLPVVGTCLCILHARSGNRTGRLLGLPVFVGIGLISYSAYLWHQPLFVFARLVSPFTPSAAAMLALSGLSLVLAYFSWKYVEQPFRNREVRLLSGRRTIFSLAAVSAAALFAVGVLGHVRDGYPTRFDPRLNDILALTDEWVDKRAACHFEGAPRPHPVADCLVSVDGPRIDVALIGDSHSLAISDEVQAELAAQGLSSYAVSYSGCIGLPGFYRVDLDTSHECDRHSRELLAFIDERDIGTVVLTARYPLYLSGDRFDNGEGGQESGDPVWIDLLEYRGEQAGRDSVDRRARVGEAMLEGIDDLLEQVNVVLVYPIPEAGWDVHIYSVRQTVLNGPGLLDISTDIAAYEARNSDILNLFAALDHPRLRKVDPAKAFCGTLVAGRCINALGDVIYYRDEDHVSYAGARLIAPAIVEAVRDVIDP